VSDIQYNQTIQCDKTSTALSSVQSKLESSLPCYQHGTCAVTTTTGGIFFLSLLGLKLNNLVSKHSLPFILLQLDDLAGNIKMGIGVATVL
jgi:hypothetical protein